MSKPDYKALRDKWYAKLAKMGFKDIETDDDRIFDWHSRRFMANNRTVGDRPSRHQEKADYYYYAEHFLNSHKFQKEIHKLVWEEHTNGVSITDIAKKLRKHRTVDRNDVYKIINYYKKLMLDTIK